MERSTSTAKCWADQADGLCESPLPLPQLHMTFTSSGRLARSGVGACSTSKAWTCRLAQTVHNWWHWIALVSNHGARRLLVMCTMLVFSELIHL